MTKPVYTIFAGINGAGKSTFYNLLNDKDDLGERINADDIAKELGDFNDRKIQYQAGKIAINKIKECIENKKSFNQETTLSGRAILKQIKELKQVGYEIRLFYVGLESKELAAKRVEMRVKNGGHNIPKETIFQRYDKSLKNLCEALKLCDDIEVHDNSGLMRSQLIAIEKNNILYKNKDIPKWFKGILEEYELNVEQNKTNEKKCLSDVINSAKNKIDKTDDKQTILMKKKSFSRVNEK